MVVRERKAASGEGDRSMSDLMKYLIDAAVGAALVMALLVVFLVDLVMHWSSGPGANTLENVRPIDVSKTHGKKLKFGVTRTGEQPNPFTRQVEKYDDMGKLLKELGSGYKDFDNLEIKDLVVNPDKIKEYGVVFLTCNTGNEEELKDVLRNYVAEGGILYASDLRFAAIQKAFPDEIAANLIGEGHPQDLEADIVDPALREVIGKKIHLKFELGEWRPAAFGGARTKVLMKGKYKKLQRNKSDPEVFAVAPLMAKFTFGKGTVFFTSFHNEKQNSETEKKLLQYLVFSLVTAGVDAEVNSTLDQGGFTPQRSNLLSTPKRDQTITKTYDNAKVADLRFALGFRDGEGAKLRFTIKSPDDKQYTWEGTSSVILEVTGAKAGVWTYSVTDLHLPYENFPFTVTVGEKK
jgi:hypothetical protein